MKVAQWFNELVSLTSFRVAYEACEQDARWGELQLEFCQLHGDVQTAIEEGQLTPVSLESS